MKAIEAYPRPLFWAVVYFCFLECVDYLFLIMAGQWQMPLLYGLVGFTLAYILFRGLRELGDGLPYWGLFFIGFFLLIFVLP